MSFENFEKLPALRELCVKRRLQSVWLFGSAVSEDAFDPSKSDVGLLVEFLDPDLGPWMKRYFDFKRECEELFGSGVDLMFHSAVNDPASRVSPYLRSTIQASKVPMYVAA